MTNANSNTMTIAEFERFLEVYGGDRTRWPAEHRAGAGQLVVRDATARRLLNEAVALDRLLERAPLPTLDAEAALADRIVAAAQRSPRMVARTAGDSSRRAAAETGNVVRLPSRRPQRRWQVGPGIGGAAGVLAASLVLGIFIGLSSVTQQMLPALEDLTGLNLNDSYATAQVDVLGEDLL